ncbi:MAG: hypothetical protein KDB63_20890 [Nocardioidaceae bacterium]|nr:hypothetical protein [Nocardioidaceae bacterium]
MLILRATRKLRAKIGGAAPMAGEASTTLLGDWYANLIGWRRPHVIVVNARTLVPVIAPLTPAKGFPGRLADVIAGALGALDVPEDVVEAERERMREVGVAPTLDRSVVGSMTDFIFLADHRRDRAALDLGELCRELAHVPCGPLYKSHTFPDAELRAVLGLADGSADPRISD